MTRGAGCSDWREAMPTHDRCMCGSPAGEGAPTIVSRGGHGGRLCRGRPWLQSRSRACPHRRLKHCPGYRCLCERRAPALRPMTGRGSFWVLYLGPPPTPTVIGSSALARDESVEFGFSQTSGQPHAKNVHLVARGRVRWPHCRASDSGRAPPHQTAPEAGGWPPLAWESDPPSSQPGPAPPQRRDLFRTPATPSGA